MSNVVTARLSSRDRIIETPPLYQYDYGQILQFTEIDLPATYEVHFGNSPYGNAVTVLGDENGVAIPDMYLTTGDAVHAWLFLHTGENDGETIYHVMIPVRMRPEVTDVPPTPVELSVITQTIAVLNSSVAHVDEVAAGMEQAITSALTEAKQSGEFDGFSPLVSVSNIPGGHRITLTDKNDTNTVDVLDGVKGDPGQDGYSPSISVHKVFHTTFVEVTDKNGTTETEIYDGDPSYLIDDSLYGRVLNRTWSIEKLWDTFMPRSDKGVSGGLAELDQNGRVPASQLPSYVDDVVDGYLYNEHFYEDAEHQHEIVGESGKVYVDNSTNITYRWGGQSFVPIGSDLALGETSSTAYRGDRGKIAYDHATETRRLNTNKETGFYKFAVTNEGHIEYTTNVTLGDLTSLGAARKSNPEFTGYLSRGRKSNTTYGAGSFAWGYNVEASSEYSHAEGYQTRASGNYTHAEGASTVASSAGSHAEGYYTKAYSTYSHVEGCYSETGSGGMYAHAEGSYTKAYGVASHAEGASTNAGGDDSHAEGYGSKAFGAYSHAEGFYTIASAVPSYNLPQTASGGRNIPIMYDSVTISDDVSSEWIPGETVLAYSKIFKVVENGQTLYYIPHNTVPAKPEPSKDNGGTLYWWHSYSLTSSDNPENIPEWDDQTLYPQNSIVKQFINGEWYYYQNHRAVETLYVPLTAGNYYHTQSAGSSVSLYTFPVIEIVGNGLFNNDENRSNARVLDVYGNEYLAGNIYVGCNPDSTGGTILPRDVQIDGDSIVSNGVATIPKGGNDSLGVVKTHNGAYGINVDSNDPGNLMINPASSEIIKDGHSYYLPIVPQRQHTAVFYGLSKAAGYDLANVQNITVGTYPEESQEAIREMIGAAKKNIITTEMTQAIIDEYPYDEGDDDGMLVVANYISTQSVNDHFETEVDAADIISAYKSGKCVTVKFVHESVQDMYATLVGFIDEYTEWGTPVPPKFTFYTDGSYNPINFGDIRITDGGKLAFYLYWD